MEYNGINILKGSEYSRSLSEYGLGPTIILGIIVFLLFIILVLSFMIFLKSRKKRIYIKLLKAAGQNIPGYTSEHSYSKPAPKQKITKDKNRDYSKKSLKKARSQEELEKRREQEEIDLLHKTMAGKLR